MVSFWIEITVLLVSAYIGAVLHEFTHYFAGRPWTDQQKIVFKYWIVPVGVDWREADLPTIAIRVVGIASFAVWLIPSILLIGWVISPLLLNGNLLGLSLLPLTAPVAATSPSDLLAFFFPGVWETRYDTKGELDVNHWEDFQALIGEFRRRM